MNLALIVEQDDNIRNLIIDFFENDIKFMVAKDYDRALIYLKAIKFDLVILDLYTIDLKIDIIKYISENTLSYLLTTFGKPSLLSITVINKPFDLDRLEEMKNILNSRLTIH